MSTTMPIHPATAEPPPTEAEATRAAAAIEAVVDNVGGVIQGKPEAIRTVVLAMLAEGHVLIEDVPGVGKTSLGKALARSFDVPFGRVQFTPDLLPTDVVGVSVWNRKAAAFDFRPGPVFASVVLADELNRASPKTQSALLEAMGERQVTVDGRTHDLARPFLVLATQNPLDHEGTHPLPESQLDRFLVRISVGYPGREAELEMLERHSRDDRGRIDSTRSVLDAEGVRSLIDITTRVHVEPALSGYLVDLAESTRQHGDLALGMSPRATLALLRASRARALAAGRAFVTPDDLQSMAIPVLAHRLLPSSEARLADRSVNDVVAELLDRVPVPRPTR